MQDARRNNPSDVAVPQSIQQVGTAHSDTSNKPVVDYTENTRADRLYNGSARLIKLIHEARRKKNVPDELWGDIMMQADKIKQDALHLAAHLRKIGEMVIDPMRHCKTPAKPKSSGRCVDCDCSPCECNAIAGTLEQK
jgi:hypothetical protein